MRYLSIFPHADGCNFSLFVNFFHWSSGTYSALASLGRTLLPSVCATHVAFVLENSSGAPRCFTRCQRCSVPSVQCRLHSAGILAWCEQDSYLRPIELIGTQNIGRCIISPGCINCAKCGASGRHQTLLADQPTKQRNNEKTYPNNGPQCPLLSSKHPVSTSFASCGQMQISAVRVEVRPVPRSVLRIRTI